MVFSCCCCYSLLFRRKRVMIIALLWWRRKKTAHGVDGQVVGGCLTPPLLLLSDSCTRRNRLYRHLSVSFFFFVHSEMRDFCWKHFGCVPIYILSLDDIPFFLNLLDRKKFFMWRHSRSKNFIFKNFQLKNRKEILMINSNQYRCSWSYSYHYTVPFRLYVHNRPNAPGQCPPSSC